MGAEVQIPKGMDVAQIHDFVIDSSSGRIILLVLSDVTSRPDTQVAIPFSALSRRDQNFFVLNATEAKLASAPSFNTYEDLNNLKFAEKVYKYFGQQPCWTEGGTR